MSISPDDLNINQILTYLKNLEARISRLEAHFDLEPLHPAEEEAVLSTSASQKAAAPDDHLEYQIGEFWFAKVGIVMFAIGIAFLLTLPYENLPPHLPGLFGYVLAGGIFALSHYWRNTFSYISRYLLGGGLVLLYFSTLRLHFFSAHPAIHNLTIELILLLLVVAVNLYVSIRRRSVYLCGLSLTLGYVTAIVSTQPYFLFSMITLLSALTVYFTRKFQWRNLLIFGIALSFTTHFIWFINSPFDFLGRELQLISSPAVNIYFILLYILIFAAGNLFRKESAVEDKPVIVSTLLNSVGGYGLFLILTLLKFKSAFTVSHILASGLFLTFAIIFWTRVRSKYSTFFYAMSGYAALTMAIIAQFEPPNFFFWLCLQSLLVVTTAIWFRSKFIVVANFIIFVFLFLANLVLIEIVSLAASQENPFIDLSFAIVALASARIMNWQKHRLELKTELMRTAYLALAFFVFPYALYHLVPGEYVSSSWVALTVFYYILSRILDNKKYRWMAILTLLLTLVRVLFVDMTGLEPAYRVVSFLVLGVVLIIISLIYTRTRTKTNGAN
jgi:uncharacterized membrane protein